MSFERSTGETFLRLFGSLLAFVHHSHSVPSTNQTRVSELPGRMCPQLLRDQATIDDDICPGDEFRFFST